MKHMKCPICGSGNVASCLSCGGNKYKCQECGYVAPQDRFN